MSLAEIKAELPKLSAEEREELAAHLAFLERQNDPEFCQELDRRMRAMDRGEEKVSRDEVLRAHQERLARGEGGVTRSFLEQGLLRIQEAQGERAYYRYFFSKIKAAGVNQRLA